MKLAEKLENLYEKLDNRREYPLRKKRKRKTTRETFMKMYNRTCEYVFFYAYEQSGNKEDADIITRDSFVYMYEHIGEVRKASSLDVWQKQCVDRSFRALLRTRLLSLVPDDADMTELRMDERARDALWCKIDKIASIDPWRLVPEPGKSTVFSVLADQTMSDLRYMTIGDYALAAGIVVGIAAILIYGTGFVINYVKSHKKADIEIMQEIYLDERNYDGFSQQSGVQVNESDIEIKYEEGGDTRVVTSSDVEGGNVYSAHGRTSGEPEYTSDGFTNAELIKLVKQLIKDDMNDFEAIETMYRYVGENIVYTSVNEEYDYEKFVGDFFEYGMGDSRHYAAAFCALCRAAGYDCEVVVGGFVLNKGTEFERIVEHYWNSISLGAIEYHLDLEADCSADGTQVRTFYFMAADGNDKWDLFERDHYFD